MPTRAREVGGWPRGGGRHVCHDRSKKDEDEEDMGKIVYKLLHCWGTRTTMIQLSNGSFMASQHYSRGELYQPTLDFFTAVNINGYVMNAVFELSIYNHSNGMYYTRKASYNFHVMSMRSKKKCFIPLEELLKSSDFLVDDSCVFGVEILKVDVFSFKKKATVAKKKVATVHNLFLQKEFIKGTYTWTMNNFLDLDLKPSVLSPTFEVGGYKWRLKMYPHGDEYRTNSLSLFLHLHASDELPPESGMMIELALSIRDQKHRKHFRVRGRFVFIAKTGWGWSNFIRLKKFKDPSRGYLVGSSCIVKAKITIIGSSNDG